MSFVARKLVPLKTYPILSRFLPSHSILSHPISSHIRILCLARGGSECDVCVASAALEEMCLTLRHNACGTKPVQQPDLSIFVQLANSSTYSGRVNNGTMLSGWSLVKTYLILIVSQGVLDSLKFYSFNSHAPAEVLCDDTFLVSRVE